MKCPNCGNETNNYDLFCPVCGEKLKHSQTHTEESSFLQKLKAVQHQTPTTPPKKTVTPPSTPQKPAQDTTQPKGIWLTTYFNFDNIGGKIKSLTKNLCWFEIVLLWIACIVMSFYSFTDEYLMELFWIWPLAALVGPFLIWIGSWFMYSIGNCIENDDKRTRYQESIAASMKNKDNK